MTNDVAGQGPALSEGLGPLPERWLCVRDNDDMPVSVWRAFQVRDYARAEVDRAVAAEREQRQQAREELVQAWNNLPDALRCHPGLKRLYAAAQRA